MRSAIFAFLLLLSACVQGVAQGPWHRGATELGVFTGGGPSISGGVQNHAFWLAGVRWGHLFTQHFEYAVEAIPLYLQFQSSTVYGIVLPRLWMGRRR